MGRGHVERRHAQFRQTLPHGRVPPARGAFDGPQPLEAVFLGEKACDGVLQLALFIAEFEIHIRQPQRPIILAMMFF